MEQRPVSRSHCSVLTVPMATSSKTLINNFPGSISPGRIRPSILPGLYLQGAFHFLKQRSLLLLAESTDWSYSRIPLHFASFYSCRGSGVARWRHAAETCTRGQVTYEGSKEGRVNQGREEPPEYRREGRRRL